MNMKLYQCNPHNLVITILFILNSMSVNAKHYIKHEANNNKKLIGLLSIEDLQKTVKLYNKIIEDPTAYYESVSQIKGQNASALIERSKNKTESTAKKIKGITSGRSTTSSTIFLSTGKIFTPTILSYEFLLQELNRKIKNLTISLSSASTVEVGEELKSTVFPGVVKIQNGNTIIENFTQSRIYNYLYSISSTMEPMLTTSLVPYHVLNSVLKTTPKPESSSGLPTNILELLENQKEIIKQLMMNIDKAQKVLTNGTVKSSVDESSTDFRSSEENGMSSNKTYESPINDISTILMKLAAVENNGLMMNMTEDRKQKPRNLLTLLLQKFLNMKSFADVQQI
ncbi:uncharacterized protein LOC111054530 [Nilaparvata lugens]|uniref:uncharacterized protein LOC111054530 n=1 Tax=Nilaparvata lugens TaxID=108931 RepID=UPI00193E1C8C|nr:uncharacterized protein LOC111054530 [Nilaparvata lugens]